MVKWYANCFVFVNIDEKLSHFVKLELKKGVIGYTSVNDPVILSISIANLIYSINRAMSKYPYTKISECFMKM